MEIPDHLTCLLRNLYVGQEATIKTGRGTMDSFKIGKGVRQGYIFSPCLFNLYAELLLSLVSCSVVSNSLWPHGLQHARLPCLSEKSPCPLESPNSRSLLKLTSIKSVMLSNYLILCVSFSCLQSFPASGSCPVSQFFASGGQSIGASHQSFQGIFRIDFL